MNKINTQNPLDVNDVADLVLKGLTMKSVSGVKHSINILSHL